MRLFSYCDDEGSPAVGVRVPGGMRPLAGLLPDAPRSLKALLQQGDAALDRLRAALEDVPISASAAVRPVPEDRLLPLLPDPGKVVCLGLNYQEHLDESGEKTPEFPTFFLRAGSSLLAHGAPLRYPDLSPQFDYEGELAVIVGRAARNVAAADAERHIAGYAVFNDASVRDYQFMNTQWTLGKNFDGTGAFGPDLVTRDEIPDCADRLEITTRLNGEVVQHSNTRLMMVPVARALEILSRCMTLEPGDVIVTGTPAGVGLARNPPLWMKPGDVCEVEIEKVGLLRNPVA